MRKPTPLLDGFEQLDDCLQALRDHILKGAHANAIGRAVAPVYLDSIARIRAYRDQLDAVLGYELCLRDQTLEEKSPPIEHSASNARATEHYVTRADRWPS